MLPTPSRLPAKARSTSGHYHDFIVMARKRRGGGAVLHVDGGKALQSGVIPVDQRAERRLLASLERGGQAAILLGDDNRWGLFGCFQAAILGMQGETATEVCGGRRES